MSYYPLPTELAPVLAEIEPRVNTINGKEVTQILHGYGFIQIEYAVINDPPAPDEVDQLVNEEALKRWTADGWLAQDFEEKGFTYRRKVLQDWLMPNE